MLETFFNKCLGLFWFRRFLALATLGFCYRLTEWAAWFSQEALTNKADLIGTAGIVTAVAAIPLGMLTLLFNKYTEVRNDADARLGKDS